MERENISPVPDARWQLSSCRLAELPVPAQCDGAIVYQALADPDGQAKELESLHRTFERLKRLAGHETMC